MDKLKFSKQDTNSLVNLEMRGNRDNIALSLWAL